MSAVPTVEKAPPNTVPHSPGLFQRLKNCVKDTYSTAKVPSAMNSARTTSDVVFTMMDTIAFVFAAELGNLAPIYITIGSMFFAILTLNFTIFMFSIASLEAAFLSGLLHNITKYALTPSMAAHAGDASVETREACESLFRHTTPSRFKSFLHEGLASSFIHTPLYFLSFTGGYILNSMAYYEKELSSLGPEYSNRPYIALISIILFLSVFSLYLLSYSCTGFFTIITSILLGLLVGYLLCAQNYFLIGKSSVSTLFVPPIVKRDGIDFLCVKT